MNVLIVEDEKSLSNEIASFLRSEEYPLRTSFYRHGCIRKNCR